MLWWPRLESFVLLINACSSVQDCIISAPKSVVTWHPSSIDRTVVIVDGNFILESGKSGYGIWISGFSGNLSNSNNIHAGIIVAILLGLCIIARRMNINHVVMLSMNQMKLIHILREVIIVHIFSQKLKTIAFRHLMIALKHPPNGTKTIS